MRSAGIRRRNGLANRRSGARRRGGLSGRSARTDPQAAPASRSITRAGAAPREPTPRMLQAASRRFWERIPAASPSGAGFRSPSPDAAKRDRHREAAGSGGSAGGRYGSRSAATPRSRPLPQVSSPFPRAAFPPRFASPVEIARLARETDSRRMPLPNMSFGSVAALRAFAPHPTVPPHAGRPRCGQAAKGRRRSGGTGQRKARTRPIRRIGKRFRRASLTAPASARDCGLSGTSRPATQAMP